MVLWWRLLNIELQDSIETSNKFCRAAGTVASIICARRKFGVACPLGRKGLGHVGDQEPNGSHSSVRSSLCGIRIRLFLREKNVIRFGIHSVEWYNVEAANAFWTHCIQLKHLHILSISMHSLWMLHTEALDVYEPPVRSYECRLTEIVLYLHFNFFLYKKNPILKTKFKTTVRHFSSQPPGVFYWRTIYERNFISLETVKKVNGLTKPPTFSTKVNFNKMLSY